MTDPLQRMLARLPEQEVPPGPDDPPDRAPARPLAALTTRDRDDPAIAMLDAWAEVLRIASFYHDRLVEEGYLARAKEDRSVLELARTVGHAPRPGVAASASLAFTVVTQPGLPDSVTIPAGTAVQSVPGQDQQPQVFETAEAVVGRVDWNVLRVAAVESPPLRPDADRLPLAGPAGVRAGDPILVAGAGPDQRYVPVVARIDTDPAGRAAIVLQAPLAGDPIVNPRAFRLPTRVRPYGHDAPELPADQARRAGGLHRYVAATGAWSRLQDGLPSVRVAAIAVVRRTGGPALLFVATDGRGVFRSSDAGASWTRAGLTGRAVPALCAGGDGTLYAAVDDDGSVVRSRDDGTTWQRMTIGGPPVTAELGAPRARIYALAAGGDVVFAATDDGVFRSTDGGGSWTLCLRVPAVRAITAADAMLMAVTTSPGLLISAPLTVTADPGQVSATFYPVPVGVIRALCPLPGSQSDVLVGTDDALVAVGTGTPAVPLPGPGVCALADDGTGGVLVALEPGAVLDDDWPVLTAAPGQDWLDLDRVIGEAVAGGWLVLQGQAGAAAWPIVAAGTVNRTDSPWQSRPARVTRVSLGAGPPLGPFLGHSVRTTEVLLSAESLPLLGAPVTGARITLDRPIPPLPAGRRLVVTGTAAGDDGSAGGRPAGEVVSVAGMPDDRTIVLDPPLRERYTAATFAAYANVAVATHGQTVAAEVLGSGDITAPAQRCTLSQAPLTYLSSTTDTGASAALVVSVDGVPWQEVATLRDAGPADEVYLARRNGEGRTEIAFGDGERGARPRTGVDNITADYRRGLGPAGNVVAGSLTLMTSRPLGVQGVTNPLPATGGADPEPAAASRSRLTGQLIAMDRLVAPADFEHFARAFAGIAAAQAAVLSADGFRLLHLTVAGLDGQTVPPGSELYENLVKAIDRRRPFGPTVRVDSYRPLPFTVAARLLVERHHDPRVVRDAAERALRDAFAVGRRDFGQAVHRGEIIALLQGVPGVTAVDLDALAPADVPVPAVARRVLPCARARWVGGAALPAEVLVLDRVALSTSGG